MGVGRNDLTNIFINFYKLSLSLATAPTCCLQLRLVVRDSSGQAIPGARVSILYVDSRGVLFPHDKLKLVAADVEVRVVNDISR